MRPDNATARKLVKEIDSNAADWFPDPALDHIVESVMNGSDPDTVIAEIQTEDMANAPFIAFEIVTQVVAIVYAIKATWDLISFLDKGTELLLDDGKKLEIAEKVVLRLKALRYPGERRTRPSKG